MEGAFAGFATITIIIALGILLAHLKVVNLQGQQTLSTIAFYVASPALLLTVLQSSDLGEIFSGNLVASGGSVVVAGGVSIVISRFRREKFGPTVIAALSSSYVNAGNLGLPIAAYALGDAALVAPTLLIQLLILQPTALTLLELSSSQTRVTVGRMLTRPLRNPITIGSAIGLVLAITGATLPDFIHDPLDLVGGMAVPSMLLAYGIALRLGPLPGRGVPPRDLGVIVGLKMVVQPVAAYVIGLLIHLSPTALLAVTVMAALPTAQNVFIMASMYRQAPLLARDAIFVSTIVSVPIILAVTALLG